MGKIHLKGNEINTSGRLLGVGENAPDFKLTGSDLADISLKDFSGKRVVLNIFPSIDTPVCAMSVRKFNEKISKHDNTVVICVSRDLPFAHARFCGAEGLDLVMSASEMKKLEFGNSYGVRMIEGPLEGLLARAVVAIDERGRIIYTQLVDEVTEEPDYEAVFRAFDQIDRKKSGGVDACLSTSTAEHSRMYNADEPCDDGMKG